MRTIFCALFLIISILSFSQPKEPESIINLRASFLLFPFSPLLTAEVKVIDDFSLQIESNFSKIHGVNFKYYQHSVMDKDYYFTGLAIVKNEQLREDGESTLLPYLGYGYVAQIGKNTSWIIDSRIGLGPILNADDFIIAPVIKAGIGYIFKN